MELHFLAFNLIFIFISSIIYFTKLITLKRKEMKNYAHNSYAKKIFKLNKFNKKLSKNHNCASSKIYISNKQDFSACALYIPFFENAIIIDESLIKKLKQNELNAVLAHEFNHIKQNHLVKTVVYSDLLVFFLSIPFLLFLQKHNLSFMKIFIVNVLFISILGHYLLYPLIMRIMQNQEKESDTFSAEATSIESFYHLANFFHKYEEEKNKFHNWFKSHPSWQERLNHVYLKLQKRYV